MLEHLLIHKIQIYNPRNFNNKEIRNDQNIKTAPNVIFVGRMVEQSIPGGTTTLNCRPL
jgi:hypothetical protein